MVLKEKELVTNDEGENGGVVEWIRGSELGGGEQRGPTNSNPNH